MHREIKDEFNEECLRMILKEVSQTGKCFDEVAEKYRLPELFIMDDNDPDDHVNYEDERMTLKQFQEKYPYKNCVVIRTRK